MQPRERSLVWVAINGVLSGATQADMFRQDLYDAGIGDGEHGFAYPVPEHVGHIEDVTAWGDDGALLKLSEGFWNDRRTNLPAWDGWRPGASCRFPSFFILGAAKCGTTSLHKYLEQHPQICMSDPKEPFFFEAESERGSTYYQNRYFAHWSEEPLVGESRHRNLYLPWIPALIHAHNPNARLIAVLRDPVDRCISHWWHWYRRRLEPLDLDAAVETDIARLAAGLQYQTAAEKGLYRRTLKTDGKGTYRSYVDSGHYSEQLERYVKLFGHDQLHVIRFEHLASDPAATVAGVLRFLGAESSHAARFDYTPHNRAELAPGQRVTPRVVERLRAYYEPHERALESLLASIRR